MQFRRLMTVLVLTLYVRTSSNRSPMTLDVIPSHLLECYRSPTPRLLPMTVRSLIDIIRKVESSTNFGMDMRILSNAILHRFWREGIERDPNVLEGSSLVVPYRTSGFQSFKYKLIMDYLIPSSAGGDIFPNDALNIHERCSLHFMLSSSVEAWERGDEATTCPQSSTEQSQRDYFEDSRRKRSSCPVEKGVVRAGGLGDVSAGRLLAAVATALAPMQVLQKYLLGESPAGEFEEELSARMARGGDLIDNKWAATLAGDLAELIVLQAPMTEILQLGPGGSWNDSTLPMSYFMRADATTVAKGFWQATDAELIGSIDGLLLASEAEKWSDISGTLRLSELLEIYYSDRGSSLAGRNRACNRKFYFHDHLAKQGKTIVLQTQYFAEVMSLTTPTYFINNTYLVIKSQQAFNAFKQYMPTILGKEPNCPTKWTVKPRLKINVIFDSTWHSYDKLKFLMLVGEDLDVSAVDGSRIEAVVNGKSGAIMAREAETLGDLYLQWNRASPRNLDPLGFELHRGLLTIKERIENETSTIQQQQKSRDADYGLRSAYGHVTIVVAPSSTITDRDMDRSQAVFRAIKAQRPEMQFVFVGSPSTVNLFQRLEGVRVDDTIGVGHVGHTRTFANKLLDTISYVPRALRPGYCRRKGTPTPGNFTYEEYVTPGIPYYYSIHPAYICRTTEYLLIKVTNPGYGSLKACLSRTKLDPLPLQLCRRAAPHDTVELAIRRPCSTLTVAPPGAQDWLPDTLHTTPCRPVYITVLGDRSLNKCSESNCRLPDQIRFTIGVAGLSCIGEGGAICSGGVPTNVVHVTLAVFTSAAVSILTGICSNQ